MYLCLGKTLGASLPFNAPKPLRGIMRSTRLDSATGSSSSLCHSKITEWQKCNDRNWRHITAAKKHYRNCSDSLPYSTYRDFRPSLYCSIWQRYEVLEGNNEQKLPEGSVLQLLLSFLCQSEYKLTKVVTKRWLDSRDFPLLSCGHQMGGRSPSGLAALLEVRGSGQLFCLGMEQRGGFKAHCHKEFMRPGCGS